MGDFLAILERVLRSSLALLADKVPGKRSAATETYTQSRRHSQRLGRVLLDPTLTLPTILQESLEELRLHLW